MFGIAVILLFEILMLAVSLLVVLFAPKFFIQNGDYVLQGTVESFLALAGIGLVAIFGYSGIWGEKTHGLLKGFWIGGYFVFVQILALFSGVMSIAQMKSDSGTLTLMPAWKIAAYIICFFLVGFTEEVFFRGLIANFFFDKHAKDPAGVWTATIWSGLLFGLMHLMNLLGSTDHAYISSILVQVVCTIAMGMALTAVYYRCRNIWVVIILHAMNNICSGIASGFFEGASLSDTLGSYPPIMAVTGSLPFIVVTMFLLRRKKMKEIVVVDDDYITPEERIKRYSNSKKSKAIAVISALAICIVLITASIGLCYDGTMESIFGESISSDFEFSAYETWNGDDFVNYTQEFVCEDSGEKIITIVSYPGNSEVMLKLTLSDSDGNVIFSESYGGRCFDTATVELEAGKTYVVTIDYDFSLVADGTELEYTVSVVI